MFVHFFLFLIPGIHWAEMWNTVNFPGLEEKCQILHPAQKLCNMFKYLIIFIPSCFILSQQ